MTMSDARIKEILDRTRRVETRLTAYLGSIGFKSGARAPVWNTRGAVHIGSLHTSIKDILAIVPSDWSESEQVAVYHRGRLLMTIQLKEPARE